MNTSVDQNTGKESEKNEDVIKLAENIINTVREPLIVLDNELRVIKANSSFYNFFKVNTDETIGKHIYSLGNGQWDIRKLRELLETILPEKTTFDDFEVEHDFTTIGKHVMLLNARQIERAFGKEKIILLAIEDITQRKVLEESLKEKNRMTSEYLDILLNYSHAPIIIWDSSLIIKRFNHEFEKLSGYHSTEVIDKKIDILFPEDQIESTLKLLNNHLNDEDLEVIEIDILTKDNNIKTVLWNSANIFDKEGTSAVATIAQDITRRKRTEEALRISEEKYRGIFENILDVYYVVSIEGTILEVSPSIEIVSKGLYHREDLIGKSMDDFYLVTEERQTLLALLKERGRVSDYEIILKNHNGSYLPCSITAKLQFDAQGKPLKIIGNMRDMTERKRVENALLESEIKYRAFFENSMDAILLTSPDGKTHSANQAACSMFGYSEDELIKLGRSGVVDATDQRLSVLLTERKLKGKAQGEATFIRKDGTNFSAEISSALFIDHEGIERTSMIIRDITERKRAEIILKQSEERFRSYIDNAPDGVFVVDETGRYIDVNESACKITGYSKNELLEMSISDILAEESLEEGLFQFIQLIQTGASKADLLFKHKNGSKRWWSLDAVKLTETSFLGFTKDITERKTTEEMLVKLSSAIEQTIDTIVITDRNGIIEYVNPSFEDLTGYSAEEALGKTPGILKSGTIDQKYYEEMWNTILSGKVLRAEVVNKKKNGDLYYEEKTISPIFDKNKNITHFVGTGIDITKRKIVEKELIASKEKAEESDRLKSSFLANMSHEVRTPLNSIIGFSELLADSYFDEEQKKEFIQNIIASGNNLLSIISDIMDISKLESGECKIRNSHINVHKFLSSVKLQFTLQAEEKKLELKLTIPATYKETVIFADAERLKQIFNNLISNAIKFTANGRIEIGYQLKGKMIEFFVKDTGIGIKAENHKIIFDRFRQIETSTTRNFGGNGLGLTISKNLVELMGGEIWLESEFMKGSTLYFNVPINSEKIK